MLKFLFIRPLPMAVFCMLINRYCNLHSRFGSRITIERNDICLTGGWFGRGKTLKAALVHASKQDLYYHIAFRLTPNCMYGLLMKDLQKRVGGSEVQLIKTSGTGYKATSGKHWVCLTHRRQVHILRSHSGRVTDCLRLLS